jgi:hypothetical protein
MSLEVFFFSRLHDLSPIEAQEETLRYLEARDYSRESWEVSAQIFRCGSWGLSQVRSQLSAALYDEYQCRYFALATALLSPDAGAACHKAALDHLAWFALPSMETGGELRVRLEQLSTSVSVRHDWALANELGEVLAKLEGSEQALRLIADAWGEECVELWMATTAQKRAPWRARATYARLYREREKHNGSFRDEVTRALERHVLTALERIETEAGKQWPQWRNHKSEIVNALQALSPHLSLRGRESFARACAQLESVALLEEGDISIAYTSPLVLLSEAIARADAEELRKLKDLVLYRSR